MKRSYRIFGADADRQRAERYARLKGTTACTLDDLSQGERDDVRDVCGLDRWDRHPDGWTARYIVRVSASSIRKEQGE